ncbi:MAG: hypothetical protein NVV74_11960 [Magnetospirillum sp.]|nr:hypothetical protein [Magnetospirillum sp.]
MTLPLEIRLEANALIDRLVADDIDTFAPAEASRLLELIPCERRRRWFAFSLREQLPGGTTKGLAAGVGTAEMENNGRSIEMSFNGDRVWRVGGYKVTHCPGELTIGLMMEFNPLIAKECFLVYRDQYKPLRLELATEWAFTLPLWRFSFELSFPGRQIWKRPQPQT